MVASRIEDFESTSYLDSNCSVYPYNPLSKKLVNKLAESSDRILAFIQQNGSFLSRPYGYDLFTSSGKPRFKSDWRERNKLAMEMRLLGFNDLNDDLIEAFSDCLYQAERISGPTEQERRDWALGLAQSSAALFTIHALNIYVQHRGLFWNIINTHVQTDALDRSNFKPAISAISKAVKKSLGWKGDADRRDEYRAEMIIALATRERQLKRDIVRLARGIEFERKCAHLLAEKHFHVHDTPKTGDFGADLIAEKDGISFAIQCKNLNKPVGVKGIQEAIGARRHYVVDFACVCTDSGFTEAALELAATNRVVTTSSSNLAESLDRAN